jgi:hypothetical protein
MRPPPEHERKNATVAECACARARLARARLPGPDIAREPFSRRARPPLLDQLAEPDVPGASIRQRAATAEADVKELRVKIDVSYHLKLHALKLLRNKKMSDAIEEALDYYFEHVVQAGPDLDAAAGDDEAKRLF